MATAREVLPDQSSSVTAGVLNHEDGLYRHTKRPEWGVAILAWEKGQRRAYQFEDGRLRKFREGYYSLMEEVDDVARPAALTASLEGALTSGAEPAAQKTLEPVATFAEQTQLFLQLYPKGFQDPAWIKDHRAPASGRALKRHRDPIVEQAKETLSKERCDALIAEERHDELVDAVTSLLSATDLVPLKDVKILGGLEGEARTRFAEAVRAMLWDEDRDVDLRFTRYLRALKDIYGESPSWRVATALPAIAAPGEHVCVRRSAFIRQAASIAPTASYTPKAQTTAYKNFLRVTQEVHARLKDAGHEPRDLLDIHDFVWATLRKASLDQLGD